MFPRCHEAYLFFRIAVVAVVAFAFVFEKTALWPLVSVPPKGAAIVVLAFQIRQLRCLVRRALIGNCIAASVMEIVVDIDMIVLVATAAANKRIVIKGFVYARALALTAATTTI